jgi:hypothetical protein
MHSTETVREDAREKGEERRCEGEREGDKSKGCEGKERYEKIEREEM